MIDIEEQLRICEAATAGPWYGEIDIVEYRPNHKDPFAEQGGDIRSKSVPYDNYVIVGGAQDEQGGAVGVLTEFDRAFIIAARTNYPLALAELAELRAQMSAVEALCADGLQDEYECSLAAKIMAVVGEAK